MSNVQPSELFVFPHGSTISLTDLKTNFFLLRASFFFFFQIRDAGWHMDENKKKKERDRQKGGRGEKGGCPCNDDLGDRLQDFEVQKQEESEDDREWICPGD